VLVRGGETLSLGGDVTVSVHAIPGHTAGSVAYVVDGQDDVFVGDAVQVHGAANGFPGYEDPVAYRASLAYLRDVVRPRHLYLGHPYRTAAGVPYGVELDADSALRALTESLEIEASVADAARRWPGDTARVAEELGYRGDPTLEPSPFFTTVHGYTAKEHA
jgi:glyoxylase-like metal-dependent hydrolase (beta-lactamase superfamily II)